MEQYLSRSPLFYLKRAQKTFENMINNNSFCHHLDFLNYIEIKDGLEYEFSYDKGPFLSPYGVLTVEDIRQDIARDIELNWAKISKKVVIFQ